MKHIKTYVKLISLIATLLTCMHTIAQVGINNNNPKATIEISASNLSNPSNTDGILIPRISSFPSMNPGELQHSMIVYLINTDGSNTPGFYFWDDNRNNWIAMGADSDTKIEYINELTDGKSDSDGSEDGSSIFLGINAGANDDGSDNQNIGIGFNSLTNATTANGNIAIGHSSLISATTTMNNVALGINALSSQTTGGSNIAIGANTLSSSTNKWSMIAIGSNALSSNTTGGTNIGIGNNALSTNTTGGKNIALGTSTLQYAVDVENTTAIGPYAMRNLLTGEGNTAIGAYAMNFFEGVATGGGTPNGNTAIGNLALSKMTNGPSDTDGIGNTAIGFEALEWGTIQNYNTAIGHFAGFHSGRDGTEVKNNTFIGKSSGFATTGSNNTFIGSNAGGHGTGTGSTDYATGSNNVFIGFQAGNNTTHADTDDQLVIANSNTSTPLIYGEFNTNKVTINGTVEATTIHLNNIPVYTGNSNAISNGLVAGDVYRLSNGNLRIVY